MEEGGQKGSTANVIEFSDKSSIKISRRPIQKRGTLGGNVPEKERLVKWMNLK